MKIEKILASRVFDSRARPTVEATVILENGIRASASVPSGASTGSHEAHEKRDGGKRYLGSDVTEAINAVESEISPLLRGFDVTAQRVIDNRMCIADGTENKSRLGANAVLAVSEAVARTAALSLGVPLFAYIGGMTAGKIPIPMMNILNGGRHASNNAEIQEFMIMPFFSSFEECMEAGTVIYRLLGENLRKKGLGTGLGDEGGYAPELRNDREGLELICEAVNKAGYSDKNVKLAIDCAANEWVDGKGSYILPKTQKHTGAEELTEFYVSLAKDFPLASIEDPLGEEDFRAFSALTSLLRGKVQVVGDDLFVTDRKRLEKGAAEGAGTAILIKPNQNGTVTGTLQTIDTARVNGYATVISHRSGETEDSFIADLAVGVNAGQIKTGAPARGERTAKYNRLLYIENLLGGRI